MTYQNLKAEASKAIGVFSEKAYQPNQAMAEAYRSGHYTLKAVGEYFGVSYATVSRAVKEYECEM